MTILSNHYLHSYKATASIHKRILTPKKVPYIKTTILSKKISIPYKAGKKIMGKGQQHRNYSSSTVALLMSGMNIPHQKPSEIDWSMACDCHATSSMGWSTTTNDILSPSLRIQTNWFASSIYPVIEETSNDYNEETNEEMWSHLDYIEYLYD